jgi:hypothetical protein
VKEEGNLGRVGTPTLERLSAPDIEDNTNSETNGTGFGVYVYEKLEPLTGIEPVTSSLPRKINPLRALTPGSMSFILRHSIWPIFGQFLFELGDNGQ